MQALIDFLVRNLMAFCPLWRVRPWQAGIRVRWSRWVEEFGPGVHWRIPFVDETYVEDAAERTIDLRIGSVTTTDGRGVSVSANVSYRIASLARMYTNVVIHDQSIGNLAFGLLVEACARKSWDELLASRETLGEYLIAALLTMADEWGVEVTRVHVTDLAASRQVRLYTDSLNALP